MNEALAHVALFPHTHPHPQMSTLEDFVFTLIFLAIVLAIGRLFIVAISSWRQKNAREKNQ